MSREHYKRTNREIIIDIYREMYANSEPPVSFDYLMENSPKDEEGRIIIPYMDYYLDEATQKKILNKHLSKNRVSKENAKAIQFNVWLGCSPNSYKKDKEN